MSDGIPVHPEQFLRAAIRLALESVAVGGGPFGAVVVRGSEVVGRGRNEVTLSNDPTAHAEIMAIRDACSTLETFALRGCELFTTCEPCPMCLGAILWARLDRIWFGSTRDEAAAVGFDDRAFYNELAKPVHDRDIPMRRLLPDESRAAFDAWKTAPNRTPY
jgi:tRNA(Arg) A34 adenosine deaminase TadA